MRALLLLTKLMEPRVLDIRRPTLAFALVACALALLATRAEGAALRDIRTDVKDREGYTRCVIELSEETEFFHRDFLAQRRYFLVDIYKIDPRIVERFITPNTGPVVQIHALNRTASDESNVMTLVFHLTGVRRYRVFTVNNPFRIVIDIMHTDASPGTLPQPAQIDDRSPAAQTAHRPADGDRNGKKIIIIDPGHGGRDPGAQSYIKVNGSKINEKDINLVVAKLLKRLIDASPNMEAHLTRTTDRYMSLGDRVRVCKQFEGDADMFVSIHSNASDSYKTRAARGIELYYLNPRAATRGAARYLREFEEQNGKTDSSSNLNLVLKALAEESYWRMLQEGKVVCEYLKASCYQIDYYKRYTNRERVIQDANFFVLIQPDLPSVLVELGFVTNSYDCKRLINSQFQQQVATALYNGISAYFNKRDNQFQPKYLALPAGPK